MCAVLLAFVPSIGLAVVAAMAVTEGRAVSAVAYLVGAIGLAMASRRVVKRADERGGHEDGHA